ncbi:MAG: acyltransferase family protein [Saprospiraceae bacterium]|nr:acyltransferase family protein [Saprospiraceae bacterium]
MNEQPTSSLSGTGQEEKKQAATLSLFWADRLRNLATVMVVAIHVSGSVAQGNTEYDTFFWWTGNLWDSMARPSVPLFVMLSGFLLLGKDYELGYFLNRRFSRVVVPALFWMVIYSFYNFKSKGAPATIADAIRGIVEKPVHYHLWFIYLIIGLYMVYPILRPWIRTAKERDYLYFFACCILGTWVYKILWVFFGISIGVYFELFTNNCGYFVLGYYLGNKPMRGEDTIPEGRIAPWPFSAAQLSLIALALIIAGTGITAVGTWWASKAFGGTFHPYFYDYLTPNCAMAAAGWFLLAKWTFNRAPLLDIEKELAAASFGIYFIHVLVMDWWSHAGYWQTEIHPAAGIPAVLCMVMLMSFAVIASIRALPGGQKIT